MALSQAALEGIMKSQTDVIFLETLEIITPEETLRIVNDNQNLETDHGTYQRFPFKVATSAATDTKPPQLTITGDTGDRRLIHQLREVAGVDEDVIVIYRVVTKQDPNHNEYGPSTFRLDSVSGNGYTKATLSCTFFRAGLSDGYPTLQISPAMAGK